LFPKCGQVLAVNRRVKARQLVSVSDIALEANEGMLVTLPGPIPVISGFDTTGTDYEFQIGSPGNTAWVGSDTFLPDNIGYSTIPAPGQILDAVTGIVAVRHPNAFDTTTRLRLEPRRDNDVDRDYTDVGEPDSLHVVHAFRLGTNVPNPFNPHTTIEYVVPETSDTRIEIYDAHGARVRQLVSRHALAAGTYRATWDGTDDAGHGVASGLYIARLYAGQRTASRKMLLLR
jgi:hypothetical protein